VKARHILCEKQSKILEAQNILKTQSGDRPSPGEFGRVAEQFSECSSAKRGGDLGWFPRGKMIGAFQEVAFNLEPGTMSEPFRTSEGYHIVLVEGRRN
jgi:peptidyl-prolyl cis-trans isomerase NIMA-interacting 4